MTPFPAWTWRIPEYFNIGVACTDAHLDTPRANQIAVICDDDVRGDRALTYAQLADQTSRFAQLLRDLGLCAGDRVVVRLRNCIEYPIVFLGALKAGVLPVPTSPMLTADELRFVLGDSTAVAIVTDLDSCEAVGSSLVGWGDVRLLIVTDDSNDSTDQKDRIHLKRALDEISRCAPPHPTRAEDPAYLVYTSGSSGHPKGVLHAHRSLIGRQPSSEYWFDFLPAGERILHAGKYNWTYVLGTGMMDPLYRGHTAIVHDGTIDAMLWPMLIRKHQATTFIAVPTVYRQILQHTPFDRSAVPSLRHCMCAGEALSGEVLTQWRERFGLEIYEGLGMTECSYYISHTRQRPIRSEATGFAQPGHDVKLLDPDTLGEVAPDEEGMLCIPRTDPALMLRYWNQPDETARCFKGDWFLTGDYARRDADGYIYFLGRKDDLINTFGYRVSPHEVERVLKEHPHVADAAAVGEEVAPGKILVAAHVIRRPASALSCEALLHFAAERLASYKVPRVIHFTDHLPRTRNGKVLRRALRAPAAVPVQGETPSRR